MMLENHRERHVRVLVAGVDPVCCQFSGANPMTIATAAIPKTNSDAKY
jgi:hypothetical protein